MLSIYESPKDVWDDHLVRLPNDETRQREIAERKAYWLAKRRATQNNGQPDRSLKVSVLRRVLGYTNDKGEPVGPFEERTSAVATDSSGFSIVSESVR